MMLQEYHKNDPAGCNHENKNNNGEKQTHTNAHESTNRNENNSDHNNSHDDIPINA